MTRLGALRTAVLLAAGFVVLRVAYRIVFGGTGGGGTVLLDLPRIRLDGPFEHISLFGPITAEGIANAALSALPFAALVLALGLLSVVIDLQALLARGAIRGPLRTVSRILVVALATFPALLESLRRVRVARELRGERSAASLIVPVLERTVERAIVLGASMEVRGYAATGRAEPVCERPASLRNVSLGFDGAAVLERIDLELTPGTLTLVTGATGSGKSTFLDALSGLFQHVSAGDQRGTIEVAGVDRLRVPPRETAGFVGVVAQSVRSSFVAATVAEELGFALAIRRVDPLIVHARVAEIAERLGITHLVDREVTALSAGEACLVAVGAAITEHPVLLLVDEPLAELDSAARTRVVEVLGALAHDAGVCVVVAEHAVRGWGAVPDARLELHNGSVRLVEHAAVADPGPVRPLPARVAGAPIAHVRGLSVRHGDVPAVDDVTFDLRAGEMVALRGPNGAGKSSLMMAIARPREDGVVVVGDDDVHLLGREVRRRAVALVPEGYDDLLFATTVAEECRRADRNGGGRRGETVATFGRLLGREPGSMLSRHPRDLSAGERLCLVIAIQLSAHPRVLLVDEPARGLDDAARRLVGNALVEAAAAGAAVVFATHDQEFAAVYATRTLTMAAGHVAEPVGVTT